MPLVRQLRLSVKGRNVAYLAFFGVSLLPWKGVDLAGRLLAVSGFLSVSTLLLLGSHAWSMSGEGARPGRAQTDTLLWLGSITGLLLYVMVLGRFEPDPYSLGYFRDFALLTALVAGLAWFFGKWMTAVAFMAALVFWQARLLPSPNLWDYLTDPWLVAAGIFRAGFLLWSGCVRSFHKVRSFISNLRHNNCGGPE
ncbi:hypothetical protein [Alcanivorax sp.]|uniref:hypothetical protein n=1 Tax=Alcanivorax sp. TaxID=1872427 RepID=UPI00258F0FDD|nr:hypothetical protein [Alcanivorax sp.]